MIIIAIADLIVSILNKKQVSRPVPGKIGGLLKLNIFRRVGEP